MHVWLPLSLLQEDGQLACTPCTTQPHVRTKKAAVAAIAGNCAAPGAPGSRMLQLLVTAGAHGLGLRSMGHAEKASGTVRRGVVASWATGARLQLQ
jgi:hypothetical protein